MSDMLSRVTKGKKNVLHVCSRDIILDLRDQILRLHGYDVVSTLSLIKAPNLFESQFFDLVLVDVEGQNRVPQAEELCAEIRSLRPRQKVAFVCNHHVSIDSDCPDEIIQAQFNPVAFVEGVRHVLCP